MISKSRIDSIGLQLINYGVGVVSENAARKIAEAVPETPRKVKADVLVQAIQNLAKSGEVEVLDVGGKIALE